MFHGTFVEPFDTGAAATTFPVSYKNPQVQAVCQNASKLDGLRQSYIGIMQDMVTKLNAIDQSSSLNDRLSGYKTQLVRINDVSNALTSIIGLFNGDDSTSTANAVQNLVSLAEGLGGGTETTSLSATKDLLNTVEASLKLLYSLTQKLERIRNFLISFLNISNQNLGYARLLCLKKQFLDPTIMTLATSLNTSLQACETALLSWCQAMAATDTSVSSACQTCQTASGTLSSSSTSGTLTTTPTGSVGGTSAVSPTGSLTGAATAAGPCGQLQSVCLSSGGSPTLCQAVYTQCLSSPLGGSQTTCPPGTGDIVYMKSDLDTYQKIKSEFNVDRVVGNVGDCPVTKMTYDQKKQEYEITTHPDIDQWGVSNTLWGANGGVVPDYVAQKMNIANRCKGINDFDIRSSAAIKNYVPVSTANSLQSAATAAAQRAQTCEQSFDSGSCTVPVEGFDAPAYTAVITQTDGSTTDTSSMYQTCPTVAPVGTMSYDIRHHKDYPSLMKNYTANCKLPKICQNYVDCSNVPIENNPDIVKYVLRSSVPPPQTCKQLADYNLQDHPDFGIYNQTWQAKLDVESQAAADAATSSCQSTLGQYTAKDANGNPTPCKALSDYKLQQHPDFPAYTQAWKATLDQYAGRNACGQYQKCKAVGQYSLADIPAAQSLTAQLAACQASLSAQSTVSTTSGAASATSQCNPQSYDITQHPDIAKYVLRSTIPNMMDKYQCAEQKQKLLRRLEKARGGAQSGGTATDMSQYVLRKNVVPCPTKDDIRQNISTYLSPTDMQSACSAAGYSESCADHFVKASGVETFDNPTDTRQTETPMLSMAIKPYPQPHIPSSDPYDIYNHKDYRYDDATAGHMPKSEAYAYAHIDNGKAVPCRVAMERVRKQCKPLGDHDITQHPEYESTLFRFGAVRDRCGKIVPAPECPTTTDQCGNVVRDTSDTRGRSCCDSELRKQKLRFNALLKRYEALLSSSQTNTAQMQAMHSTLAQMQTSINSSQTTPASAAPPTTAPAATADSTQQAPATAAPAQDQQDASGKAQSGQPVVQPMMDVSTADGWLPSDAQLLDAPGSMWLPTNTSPYAVT